MNQRQQRFQRAYPATPACVHERVEDTLSALRRQHPVRPVKRRMTLALAAAFTLICAVALAIGLKWSPQYDAVRVARAALSEKYGITQEMLGLFIEHKNTAPDGVTTVTYYSDGSEFVDADAVGAYTVTVQGGKAAASWSHDDVDAASYADGDLTSKVWGAAQLTESLKRYAAMREWETRNANVYDLPMDEQQKRFDELYALVAPLTVYRGPWSAEEAEKLEPTPSPAPTQDEAEAIAAAKRALSDKYGLTEEMLGLFTASASPDAADGQAVWSVAFLPTEPAVPGVMDWRWTHIYVERLGSYTVTLAADGGAVTGAGWSLDGVETDAFTQSNWGSAKAFDARILEWVLDLQRRNAPIVAQYPDLQTEWFAVEDAAAYDQAFRDAGFDPERYCHGVPEAGELTQEQAVMLARQALCEEYGLEDEQIDRETYTAEYLLRDGGEWVIGLRDSNGQGYVRMSADDGEIRMVYMDSGAGANG